MLQAELGPRSPVRVSGLNEISAYDLALYEAVVFTEPAILRLSEDLKP